MAFRQRWLAHSRPCSDQAGDADRPLGAYSLAVGPDGSHAPWRTPARLRSRRAVRCRVVSIGRPGHAGRHETFACRFEPRREHRARAMSAARKPPMSISCESAILILRASLTATTKPPARQCPTARCTQQTTSLHRVSCVMIISQFVFGSISRTRPFASIPMRTVRRRREPPHRRDLTAHRVSRIVRNCTPQWPQEWCETATAAAPNDDGPASADPSFDFDAV